MSGRDEAAVRAALAPDPADERMTRLGKLAALSLIDAGKPVTRSSFAAASKTIDDDDDRKKRGFSESSLRTSEPLRNVYKVARTTPMKVALRRRGRVGAHIIRLKKMQIVAALVVARLATAERDEEHRLAVARLGTPFATPDVDAIRAQREELAANRVAAPKTEVSKAAELKTDAAAGNAAAIARARTWAERRGIRATAEWLAARCKLHPGTVERHAALHAASASGKQTYDFEVHLPPALMRLRKWDLGRALQLERDYIKAIHAATMAVALIVIDREHLQRRADVRAAG